MLRRLAPVLLCVSALLCSAHFSAAGVSLRVDESRSRFFFDDEDKTAGASLLVMNPTAREFAARVFVELLDTEDRVRSKDERVASLRPGANTVKTELPFSVAASGDADRLPWYRLRYRVAPEGERGRRRPFRGRRLALGDQPRLLRAASLRPRVHLRGHALPRARPRDAPRLAPPREGRARQRRGGA